jgi:hypothetical protein
MLEINQFREYLGNRHKERNRLIECPHNFNQQGRKIQEAFLRLHPKWSHEIPLSTGFRPNERFDLYHKTSRTIKIIEVASLRADQISKNFVSRIDWCIQFLAAHPKMRIEFVILCYNSNNQENPDAAISYLRSCQILANSIKVELTFSCYHVIDGNFGQLE